MIKYATLELLAKMKTQSTVTLTNDKIVRAALKVALRDHYAIDKQLRIIEEFSVEHGAARVDIAVVNGRLHGYEIKSDRDTLWRLPEQMDSYNGVFDRVTLVVGKQHLFEAVNIIPDWWGIIIAKIDASHSVVFNSIREARRNPARNSVSIARLLWRSEALKILEEAGRADGVRSKPRELIYERLSSTFDQHRLALMVRNALFLRGAWRSGAPLMPNGG